MYKNLHFQFPCVTRHLFLMKKSTKHKQTFYLMLFQLEYNSKTDFQYSNCSITNLYSYMHFLLFESNWLLLVNVINLP